MQKGALRESEHRVVNFGKTFVNSDQKINIAFLMRLPNCVHTTTRKVCAAYADEKMSKNYVSKHKKHALHPKNAKKS
jgi:hypothetical protein